MRRLRIVLAIAATSLGAVAAAPVSSPLHPAGAVAKTCRAGYVHAVIGGKEKCLRRGQYCAHRFDSQYKRYGFRCIHRDRNGRFHLSKA